jgi:dienelactone hydrolase
VVKIGDYDRAALQQLVSAGVQLDNGYSVYTLTLMSAGRETLATVTVPYGAAAPPGGWHLVANQHGTTGIDDPCRVAGTVAGAGLAGLFGARGFVGVAPEYPGLGTAGLLPYLVTQVEGRAVLDAVRATRLLLRGLGVPHSGRAAVVGLSQGGHAVLAAAALHKAYARELDIRAFAAAAPATVWEEHFRLAVAVDGPHIPVHAMLVYAWATHYGYRGPPLWTDPVARTIDADMRLACVFSYTGAPALGDRLPAAAGQVFSPGFLAAYRTGFTGPYAPFAAWFQENRVRPYEQTAPLKIYQGTDDAWVPESTTRQAVEALRQGGVQVDYEVVPGATHFDLAFGFVTAAEKRTRESVAWLRERLSAN